MSDYPLAWGGYVTETGTSTLVTSDGFTNESLLVDSTITAAAGSYVLTGTAATPRSGREVAAATAAYALTGTAATPIFGSLGQFTAAAGSYALTGTAAAFTLEVNIEEPVGIDEDLVTDIPESLAPIYLRVRRV